VWIALWVAKVTTHYMVMTHIAVFTAARALMMLETVSCRLFGRKAVHGCMTVLTGLLR
jgi:hypothetical protein